MMILKRNQVYNQFKPGISPAVTVKSGERLLIETQDALFGRSKDVCAGLLDRGYVAAHANPITGPIAVEGAEPGDALAVEINGIKLENAGFLSVPNRGGYEYVEIKVDPEGMLLLPSIGKRFPSMPMIGVIGTANPSDGGFFGTDCGDHGGNMDNNAICAGAAVYLPVFCDGGMLGFGDVHAAMCDGELFGQGVEIEAELDVTITLHKSMKLKRPLIASRECIFTAAQAEHLQLAGETAADDMRYILEYYYGLVPINAALAVALYGHMRVCQVCNQLKTMRVELSRDIISLFSDKIVF